MTFLRQTWALTRKNLLRVLVRRWLTTPLRALILPIVFVLIISYAKNWALPAGRYGIGSPSQIMSLSEALAASDYTRDTVVIIDDGRKTGDIGRVVRELSSIVHASGKQLRVLDSVSSLRKICQGSLLGVSFPELSAHRTLSSRKEISH